MQSCGPELLSDNPFRCLWTGPLCFWVATTDAIVWAQTILRQPLSIPVDGPIALVDGSYRSNRVGPNRFLIAHSDGIC